MNLRGILEEGADASFQEELKILNLTLKSQEGEFMQIELLCERRELNTESITLFCDGTVFFKGHLLGGVEYVEPDCMKLVYIGRARNLKYESPQGTSLLENVDVKKWEMACVDPVSHDYKKISMLPQANGPDITQNILCDSLKIEQIRVPLKNIKVIIHASWVQKGQGTINLFPYIKKAFPRRRVLSMTGDALKASFPSIGQTLGKKMGSKTGYTVLSSKIIPFSPAPFSTVPVQIKDTPYALPVKEYKGHFWIQWACAYKRQEKFELQLSWKNGEYTPHKYDPSMNVCKIFEFKVKRDEIEAEQDVFFSTGKGLLAILQAVEQSIYTGLQSRQSYLLKVDLPFSEAVNHRVGGAVRVKTKEGRIVKGRISRLHGFCDVHSAKVTVWINFSKEELKINRLPLLLEGVVLGIQDRKTESEKTGLPNLVDVEPEDFIKNVVIRSASHQQEEILRNREFDSKVSLVNVLKENMTEIYLDMHDLTNKDAIHRNYDFINQ